MPHRISLFVILITTYFLAGCSNNRIYVSPSGSDSSIGTSEEQLATLHAALAKARSMASKPEIILQGGTYYLKKPIVFDAKDSGTQDDPLVIRPEKGEQVILSGGRKLHISWQPH